MVDDPHAISQDLRLLLKQHSRELWRLRITAIVFAAVALSQLWIIERLKIDVTRAIGQLAANACDLKHQNDMIKLANEFISAHELFEDFRAEWAEEAQRYHKACHAGAA